MKTKCLALKKAAINYPSLFWWGAVTFGIAILLLWCPDALADGTDGTKGTDHLSAVLPDIKSTIEGTGKKLLLGVEAIVAVLHFYKTRTPTVFIGYIVVLIFTNYALSL